MSNPLDQPAAKAPPGQHSNLVNPPSQGYIWIITVTICMTCITIMVAVRMYVGAFVIRHFRWDDFLVLAAWVMLIGYSTVAIEFIKYGGYTDIWNVSLGNLIHWKQLTYTEQLLYSIFFFMIKLAVLVLYRRIFVPLRARNWVYYSINAVIIFNALFYIANTFVRIFVCNPIKKAWLSTIDGKCVNVPAVIISTSALNIVSDLFILIIPVAVIRKLQVSRKRRLEILAIFACGILCFMSSVARLAYSIINLGSPNPTVSLMSVAAWTFGELTSCFLASCVPMVPRLIRHLRDKEHSTRSSRSTMPVLPQEQPPKPMGRNKKNSLWSALSTFNEKTQHDQEDPYLMSQASTKDEESDTSSEKGNEKDIFVSQTVDISSLPRAHVPERKLM